MPIPSVQALEQHLNISFSGEAPDRHQLRRSPYRNTYLLDDQGQVVGLHLGEEMEGSLELGEAFTDLKLLKIKSSRLREVIFKVDLPALDLLDLSECGLESFQLPYRFPRLKILILHHNPLPRVNLEGPELAALEIVDLSYCPLTQLRLSRPLPRLGYFYAYGCPLEAFSTDQNLPELQVLELRKTSLQTIQLESCPRIERLDLSGLQLQTFPPDMIHKLPALLTLVLKDNPIQNIPPELFDKDEGVWESVRDYFLELEKGQIINERAKLILVGNGRVGKTSLYKRLRGLDFDNHEPYTHGIKIGRLEKKDLPEAKTENLQFNVWDFGGQEIFYATHQFFLTDGALYILAWTDEQNVIPHRERDKETLPFDEKWQSCEYWLDTIRRRAATSPIVMVQTHSDKGKTPIDEVAFTKDPYRAECLNFSALKKYGLEELKETLTQKLNGLAMYGAEFPKTYEQVIAKIEYHKNADEGMISRQEFINKICREANINEGGEASLLDYLDKTGLIIYYPEHPKLKDKIYINPDWLTRQVYSLINNALHDTQGKITEAYLKEKLPHYQEAELIELFKAFELIFEVENEKERYWIAPQYLPDDLPDERAQEFFDQLFEMVSLGFVFRFSSFVPDNVMVNFLSRYGSLSKKNYWKNGLSFTKDRIPCIVKYQEDEKSIFVYTDLNKEGSKALLKEVCQAFSEFGKNARAEISVDNQHFVRYDKLKDWIKKEAPVIESLEGNILKMADFDFLFEIPTIKALKTPNQANLFYLIEQAFDDSGLKDFCFRYFNKVYGSFGSDSDKPPKIRALITYCRQHAQLPYLTEKIKEERPKMYAQYEKVLWIGDPDFSDQPQP
ncbi:MAG: hypothetical protein HC880_22270 [Bacteroidia bacterium]|nr:hypothetical protein [Bacteroidia bacterium]